MKNNIIRSVVFFLIMFFSTAFLCALDEDPSFRLGVGKIAYTGIGPDSISGGISNRLFEVLSGISERRISPDEIRAILTEKKDKDLNTKILELEALAAGRALLLFSGESRDYISRAIMEKDELIESLKHEIDILRTELGEEGHLVGKDDFTLVPVEAAVPSDGNLFLMKAGPAADTASANDLDLLVYGSIEELDDYYFIEIKVWSNIVGRHIAGWKSAARYDELETEIQQGINELKSGILGREWAGLIVHSSANSMIYIDGEFAGIGRIGNTELIPGPHLVMVRQTGFESVEHELELKARETEIISLDTRNRVDRKIIIQTFPQGADLYIDSVWAGTTPMRADIKTFPTAIRLRRDGWEDKEFFIEKDSENLININLKPDSADRNRWVEDNRGRFYASLGAFVLSIPLTAFCYGGIEQTALAYNSEYAANGTTNLDELNRLESINQGLYAAYLGSLGLNIILLFDTIMQAVDYVGSVDYVSN